MTPLFARLPFAALLACTPALSGCATALPVERAYGGRVVYGRFIADDSYAAYLRGVLAESDGRLKDALAAYEQASALDPSGPEVWARIAAVRCASAPTDPRADRALDRALAEDADSSAAFAARAACALARRSPRGARAAAPWTEPSLARVSPAQRGASSREAAIARSLDSADVVGSLGALAGWGEAQNDVALTAWAAKRVARFGPSFRDRTAAAAERIARAGERGVARAVAAAAVDASDQPFDAERYPLAARLAVDEAIASGDVERVTRRATRARISLEESAGRALLVGRARLARELAAFVTRAAGPADDPLEARLVLLADERHGVGTEFPKSQSPVSAAVWVALASALARETSPAEAQAALTPLNRTPIIPGDALVTEAAAALPPVPPH